MIPLGNMYFGVDIVMSNLNEQDLKFIKLKCLEFYIESLDQILKRFPMKNNLLQEFEFLNPEKVRLKKINSIAHIPGKLG